MSIQELREKRNQKVGEAQHLVASYEGAAWTPKINQKYNGLLAEIADIDAQIDRHQRIMDQASPGGTNIDPVTNRRTPITGRDGKIPAKNPEHTAAFWNFIRTGNDADLRQFSIKGAMSTGKGAEGGFMIPEEIDGIIDQTAFLQSGMRNICEGRVITTPEYQRLISVHGTGAGWVDEEEGRPETEIPNLKKVKPDWGTLYAYPQVSQDMLDFSAYDVEGFLINEVSNKFGETQGDAFINGNGVKKPRGILNYPYTADADAVRPFGTFQYRPSLHATSILADALIKTVFSLKRGYRQGSCWLMNSTTAGIIMQLKDGLGRYLWADSIQAGQPPTLLGYAVELDDFVPDVEAGAIPILFGNFQKGFMIVDFPTLLTLRDPYSNKPFVGFYFLRRMGTMLKNSEAIRGIKIAES